MKVNHVFISIDIDPNIKQKKIDDLIVPPVIVNVDKFDPDAVKKFAENVFAAENTSSQPVVPIVIDSYGGQVYSLLAMIDILRAVKKPIMTIALGKAMSCGAILFTCGAGDMRFMSPEATLMIHDVSSFALGKIEELKADAAEAERLNSLVYSMMDKNCAQPSGYFKDLIHAKGHADWYINADEALKHKLATAVRVPRISVSIKLDVRVM